MVVIFKTNVTEEAHATAILEELSLRFPLALLHFDLEDCDNILRVEAQQLRVSQILEATQSLGLFCEELE